MTSVDTEASEKPRDRQRSDGEAPKPRPYRAGNNGHSAISKWGGQGCIIGGITDDQGRDTESEINSHPWEETVTGNFADSGIGSVKEIGEGPRFEHLRTRPPRFCGAKLG